MTKKPEQESFYEVHLNKYDELMISMHAREGEPNSPVLIYDGGDHALLYRTPQSSVLLDFIHPEVRPYLLKANQVLIAETKNYQVTREYTAVCKRVKNLPIDENGIKPLLSKEEAEQIDERNLYK
ncbi:MAG: hypothetical protein IJ846_02625 [Alphaproteobacteria bacterium]|nr:hypothetical protein [Alphaproteobacteria bacterium]